MPATGYGTGDPRSIALAFMDVDGFKPINDQHGRQIDDRVLAAVAEPLRHTLRASDTVAFWGADEFALLIGGLGSGNDCNVTYNGGPALLSSGTRPACTTTPSST